MTQDSARAALSELSTGMRHFNDLQNTVPRLRPVDVPATLPLVQAIYRLNGLPPPTPEELRRGPLNMQHALLELIRGRAVEEVTPLGGVAENLNRG